jgi:uncharacterized cupin superfamily protein
LAAYAAIALTAGSAAFAACPIGDSWLVKKGASVLWEVTSDRFVKNYLGVS